jgi:CheY-like chemotaxis protein
MAEILPFPVADGQRHTVLVVDDEPAIRGVLCEFLKECGYHARSAADADQAMVLIQQGGIDLVFSDVRMPGAMDGCALARWIRANKPELPVILTTGDLGKADASGLAGIEMFAKPYDFEAAVRKIHGTIILWKTRSAGAPSDQPLSRQWSSLSVGALPATQT